jgi:hypothetical protein
VARSLLTLVVALGLASLAVWAARGLQLDTGLEALLPNDSASVLAIEATRDKLGLEEPLTILVASDNRERNEALAAQLADEFAAWPEAVWVMTSYGLDALAERALYYVDAETLYEWSELAEEALDWEVCKASPLCVTIADPPELPDSEEVRAAIDRYRPVPCFGSSRGSPQSRPAAPAKAERTPPPCATTTARCVPCRSC